MSIELVVSGLVGLLIGCALGWIAGKSRNNASASAVEAATQKARADQIDRDRVALKQEFDQKVAELRVVENSRTDVQARLEETQKNLIEQKTLLEDSKKNLSDAFKALASDALKTNTEAFLELANSKLEGATSTVGEKEAAIQKIASDIQNTLDKYQKEVEQVEKQRIGQFTALNNQLDSLKDAQGTLQSETSKLVNALRSPQVRGRWGEITLQRTAELAGMSLHCDFIQQHSVATEDGLLRPDMVVKLPANRDIVVDAKVPLSGYLESLEAAGAVEREQALQRHVAQTKQHIKQLSSKQYASQFEHAPEFVVLFIPNDSFLSAAADREPTLIEDALQQNVVIATPSTFIALLRAVAFGWAQHELAANSRKIGALGEELHDRLSAYLGHVTKLGCALDSAVKAYNDSVGSLEARLLPSAKKLKELDASIQKELPEVEILERTARALTAKLGE